MSFYENHLFEKELPIIFHLDHLEKMEQCINNWHENLELIYCMEGEGEAVINSNHIPLRQGNMMIINPRSIASKLTNLVFIISSYY